MKRQIIIIIAAFFAALIIAAVTIVCIVIHNIKTSETVMPDHGTDGVYEYDYAVKPADMYFVGLWHEASNPLWYKAFYDDYAGDGYYWGKEWKENDNIFEEDLTYHGNGWFKWRRDGDKLTELHVMTMSKAPIAKRWIITVKDRKKAKTIQDADSLILSEQEYKKNIYRFAKTD